MAEIEAKIRSKLLTPEGEAETDVAQTVGAGKKDETDDVDQEK